MNNADDIRGRGWTQGSLLRATDFGLSDTELYLVISHPCDIVSSDFERDPTIEVMPARIVDSLDGNLTFGKNSRRLQVTHDGRYLEFVASEKLTIDRSQFAAVVPAGELEGGGQRLLASWLSARYARPAFADEFNRRMRPALKKIGKVLKSNGAHLSGIYVSTSAAELASDVRYELTIVATMLLEDFDVAGLFAEASEACDGLTSALAGLEGINLLSVELASEDEMSLDSLRRFRRWDYDDLSFRAGDEGTLPPAG